MATDGWLRHLKPLCDKCNAHADFRRLACHLMRKIPVWLRQPFKDGQARLTGKGFRLFQTIRHKGYYIVK